VSALSPQVTANRCVVGVLASIEHLADRHADPDDIRNSKLVQAFADTRWSSGSVSGASGVLSLAMWILLALRDAALR
jgi:hypothetical protein